MPWAFVFQTGLAMPSGSKRRGFRYSARLCPVRFCTAAESMNVAGVLYLKCVPGLWGTGWARNDFAVILSAADDVSSWCPADIVIRSRILIDFRVADGSGGASSGKI